MQLFYAPAINPPLYTLSEEESKHCIRVLRLSLGDTLYITDGKGRLFSCRVVDANVKRCQVEVVSCQEEFEKLPYELTMCVAPTKNIDRFEWFLEKATEIGLSEVVPLVSAHSERRAIKLERLEKVATSAMKQSLKAYHPKVNDLLDFKSIISRPFEGQRFIAHCNEAATPQGKLYLFSEVEAGAKVEVLIGPEGDFSPQEVQMAIECGYKEISLGDQRLRTETAALMATSMVAIANNK